MDHKEGEPPSTRGRLQERRVALREAVRTEDGGLPITNGSASLAFLASLIMFLWGLLGSNWGQGRVSWLGLSAVLAAAGVGLYGLGRRNKPVTIAVSFIYLAVAAIEFGLRPESLSGVGFIVATLLAILQIAWLTLVVSQGGRGRRSRDYGSTKY